MDIWTLAQTLDGWSRVGITLVLVGSGIAILSIAVPSLGAFEALGLLSLLFGVAMLAGEALSKLAAGFADRAQDRRSRAASERRRAAMIADGLANLSALTDAEASGLLAILRGGRDRFLLSAEHQGLRDKRIVFVETAVWGGESVYTLNPSIAERSAEIAAGLAARLAGAGEPERAPAAERRQVVAAS